MTILFFVASSLSWHAAHGRHEIVLWAWDRYEDLSFLASSGQSQNVSVAYFAGTVDLRKARPRFIPRQKKLLVPKHIQAIPVLHVVAGRGQIYREEHASLVTNTLTGLVANKAVRRIQLDFEVFESQRDFYRGLLKQIRQKLPDIFLSVTALASWCKGDVWLNGIPVDEIVPMFFDASHGSGEAERSGDRLSAECLSAAGLATYEKYDAIPLAKRYYLFSNRAWRSDALQKMLDTINHAQTY